MLYWLPLGAGGHSVRWNGRILEAIMARHQHRAVRELYHSALEVRIGDERYVIEMTPVWASDATDRGASARARSGLAALLAPHSFATRYAGGETARYPT